MRGMSPPNRPPRALMLHGAGGGGWEWSVWARVFAAAGWRVQAPDLQPARGGLAHTRWDDYLGQVRAWCVPAPDVLVGASLGGLLALAAEAAPRALVLVNPLPPRGLIDGRRYAAVVPWGTRRSLDSTCRALPDADDPTRLYAFRRWRDESGAVLTRATAGLEVAPPDCPVLVLASSADTDVPVEASRALARELGASYLEYAGASHVGPLLGRDAAAIANQVTAWLRRQAQPKKT
jgi:pimeloyl-ACP methyl ester carboxylesterase